MSEPTPGQRIGEYVLEVPLGAGGFSTVWQARHHAFPDRRVAAKLLHDSSRREMLRSEADCLRGLSHPGIARAVGVDVDHDPPYLLIELHQGRNLRQLLESTTLSPERAEGIFRQLAAALAHAHERGVAHGDLKPENVLIDHLDQVKLTDFGLGQIVSSEASLLLSGTLGTQEAPHGLAGTLPYMAPEQREGSSPDSRSDVFSLGILLHELITGQRPQPGDDPREGLRDPPNWLDVWDRLFTHRDKRYADAGGVVADLDRLESRLVVRPREVEVSVEPRRVESRDVEPLVQVRNAGSDRQRVVITPAAVHEVEAEQAQGWTLAEVERIVAQECGLRISALRAPPGSERGLGGLWNRFEERLLGFEDDVLKGRAMVWFLAHEFMREDVAYLAERYGVSAHVVSAGINAVRRRRVPQAAWRAVVGRLAAIPSGVAHEAQVAAMPSMGQAAGAATAWGVAAVLVIPALVLIAAGQFWVGAAILAAAATAAAGGGAVMASGTARREEWIESHLDVLPGQDRREKLARLAVHRELRGISRTATRLLEREPIQVRVRPRTSRPESRPQAEVPSLAIELPTAPSEPEREEPLPSVEPAPSLERASTNSGAEALIAERAARAREAPVDSGAGELIRARADRARAQEAAMDEAAMVEAAVEEAAVEEAAVEEAAVEEVVVEDGAAADALIQERAARAREAEAASVGSTAPSSSARPSLDDMIRERAARARGDDEVEAQTE
ncbi:MAG: serine/threonine protein kinase [Planctomycetes bacterium]|nr:serine/threonine protein kinase [Planctomycetota bacterium]